MLIGSQIKTNLDPTKTEEGNILETINTKLIAKALGCEQTEIKELTVIKKGMTNRSYLFTWKGERYIMRIPGEGTDKMIVREQEYNVYQQIAPLNICDDIKYINPDNGYKITVFWEDARECDPFQEEDVRACMNVLKKFHENELQVAHYFDIFERIEFYENLWQLPSCYEDYEVTKANIMSLKEHLKTYPKTLKLTHIDANHDNFLFINADQEIRLIDWEYAAMQDPHVDIAMFAIYAMYDRAQVERLIDLYFDGDCEKQIRLKIYAYIAMCGLLWSNWCEYKQQLGVGFGEYALKQYAYAKDYFQIFMNGI